MPQADTVIMIFNHFPSVTVTILGVQQVQYCHMNHLFQKTLKSVDAKVIGKMVRKAFVLQDFELSKGESMTAVKEMERSGRKSFLFVD